MLRHQRLPLWALRGKKKEIGQEIKTLNRLQMLFVAYNFTQDNDFFHRNQHSTAYNYKITHFKSVLITKINGDGLSINIHFTMQ